MVVGGRFDREAFTSDGIIVATLPVWYQTRSNGSSDNRTLLHQMTIVETTEKYEYYYRIYILGAGLFYFRLRARKHIVIIPD